MAIDFRSLRLRVRALTAGLVDDAVIESTARTRLEQLWSDWDWSFKEAHDVLATVGPHGEGTVTLGITPTLITGTGTVFTSADVGREIVVGNHNSRYTIAAVNGGLQQLTLAQPYAGAAFLNSTYKIQQSVYALAADFAESAQPVWWHKIVETSLPQMDRYDGRRAFTSSFPMMFRYAGLNAAGVQLVEISPVPAAALGIFYTYKRRLPALDDTTLILLREDFTTFLIASDALAVKAMEAAEKLPQAASLYMAQSDKYQALGLKAQLEAQFQDLQRSSPAKAIRDEYEGYRYSDDYAQQHDMFSPI